jgi:hypothetical protein
MCCCKRCWSMRLVENPRIHDINRAAYASVAIYGNVNKQAVARVLARTVCVGCDSDTANGEYLASVSLPPAVAFGDTSLRDLG